MRGAAAGRPGAAAESARRGGWPAGDGPARLVSDELYNRRRRAARGYLAGTISPFGSSPLSYEPECPSCPSLQEDTADGAESAGRAAAPAPSGRRSAVSQPSESHRDRRPPTGDEKGTLCCDAVRLYSSGRELNKLVETATCLRVCMQFYFNYPRSCSDSKANPFRRWSA